jgi:hypothetical protein
MGAAVDIYEAGDDILEGATARCQARLHRGYHYPRSDATAAAARSAYELFVTWYPAAVRKAPNHYYAVAPGGHTSSGQYLAFLERQDLAYEVADPPPLHGVDLVVRADEALIEVDTLRRLVRRELAAARRTSPVSLRLHHRVEPGELHGYDLTVWATYGQPWPRPLRYEVCELAILELGRYDRDSYVVLDGEFVSLDPWQGGRYALYDVRHSVHHVNVGTAPEVPDEYEYLVKSKGLHRPRLSRFDAMVDSASRFFPGVQPHGRGVSIYHGSKFAVRAVLPDVDSTDARPTLIEVDGDQVRILSGKICTAPAAAVEVASLVFDRVPA